VQRTVHPGMPYDAGTLPNALNSGLAMDESAGANVLGPGIEMALEYGSLLREMKARRRLVLLEGLFHRAYFFAQKGQRSEELFFPRALIPLRFQIRSCMALFFFPKAVRNPFRLE